MTRKRWVVHEWITEKLRVLTFFTGSVMIEKIIENGNKLIRQYITRNEHQYHTETKIAKIKRKINDRLRRKFNFQTLAECFFKNIRNSVFAG